MPQMKARPPQGTKNRDERPGSHDERNRHQLTVRHWGLHPAIRSSVHEGVRRMRELQEYKLKSILMNQQPSLVATVATVHQQPVYPHGQCSGQLNQR